MSELGQIREKYRISLEEGERIAEKVRQDLEPLSKELFLVGSIRRQRPSIADIEFVVLPKDLDEFDRTVRDMGLEAAGKRRKYTGILDGVKIELYIAHNPKEMGSLILMYTGDYIWNIAMRAKAKRMGLKLDQYGIWKGKKIIFQSLKERDFFDYLEFDWHDPKTRSLAARQELLKMIRGLHETVVPEEDAKLLSRARDELKEKKYISAEDEARIRQLFDKYVRLEVGASLGAEELVELGNDEGLVDELLLKTNGIWENPAKLWQDLYERMIGRGGTVRNVVVEHRQPRDIRIVVETEEEGQRAFYIAYQGQFSDQEIGTPPEEYLTGFALWATQSGEAPAWHGPLEAV